MRRGFFDTLDEPLAAIPAQRGVDEHDVDPVFLQPLQRARCPLGGGDDLEFGLGVQQGCETIAQQTIVFDYQYLNFFGHCTDGPRSEEDERIRHG